MQFWCSPHFIKVLELSLSIEKDSKQIESHLPKEIENGAP
jgi:hypothetical protein